MFEKDTHEGGEVVVSGRGAVIMFHYDDESLALKPYVRGGLPRRFIKETYLYIGLEKTRMWREFRLLEQMRDYNLPVPVPVAARCQVLTPFSYRGDLITRRIPGASSLSDIISAQSLSDFTWSRIGEKIALFHQHQVFHIDLNAHNILLTADGKIYLVDFDKCYFRRRSASDTRRWNQATLKRLHRSLRKLKTRQNEFYFDERKWTVLLDGYNNSSASTTYMQHPLQNNEAVG